ncbi:hypothetical protein LIER_42018 [Lithospermum erythrorhizon]|uniref:H15 domain-containing protein n=1 Tax=Lithospermum erythrorhizon TaxID=34254 RepID=A0AAV3RI63_LITER
MIQEAIEQLNEEEGSSKEVISTSIKNNYNDLPWNHDGMLEHHLNLLWKNGDLVKTKDGHYLVSDGANEKITCASCSLASTADTSLNVGTAYNSYSNASSSSSSGSDCKSKARIRKRNGKLGKSVERNEKFARRTKSSIRRLGRPSKKDDFLISSEVTATTKHGLMLQEEEKDALNGVASEQYRITVQPGNGAPDTDDEHENQKKEFRFASMPSGRKRCGKRKLNGERKKTAKMETRVLGKGRGRPLKKVVLEVSGEENCLMTEDKVGVAKHGTKSLNDQNVDIIEVKEVILGESKVTKPDEAEKCNNEGDISLSYDEHKTEEVVKQQNIVSDGIHDELVEKQNDHVDYANEVTGKQNKLLDLLQESASGEFLLDQEDKEEEDITLIEVLARHTKATTKNPGRKNIRKCKQGANAKEITLIQSPIAGRASGKQRGRIRKNLAFEETKVSEEMAANSSTTGKVHQIQEVVESNLQDIPSKVQIATRGQNSPYEGRMMARKRKVNCRIEMKKVKKKRKSTSTPGPKRGSPPKNETSTQLQMIPEQLKTMEL